MNKRVRKCIHKDKDPKCADCPDRPPKPKKPDSLVDKFLIKVFGL